MQLGVVGSAEVIRLSVAPTTSVSVALMATSSQRWWKFPLTRPPPFFYSTITLSRLADEVFYLFFCLFLVVFPPQVNNSLTLPLVSSEGAAYIPFAQSSAVNRWTFVADKHQRTSNVVFFCFLYYEKKDQPWLFFLVSFEK